jgi:hypothetical protein
MGKVLYQTVNDALDAKIIRIPEVSCWLWGGATHQKGYGVFSFRKKIKSAHRAMFERYNGKIKDNFLVCHTCDNPWCVNPEHLFQGTPNDNMQDKVKKGRQSKGPEHTKTFINSTLFKKNAPRGERHGMSKLTDMQRVDILQLIKIGKTQKEIATQYNVSQPLISHTLNKWNKGSYGIL